MLMFLTIFGASVAATLLVDFLDIEGVRSTGRRRYGRYGDVKGRIKVKAPYKGSTVVRGA